MTDILNKEEIPNSDIQFHDNGVVKLEKIKVTEKLFKHVHYDIKGQITKVIDYDDLGKELNTIELSTETSENGLSFTYYPNGNVQSLKYFINGKINWVEKLFDEEGQVVEVISYNKGTKSGPHTIYSKRNAKLSEVTYSGNLPSGKAKFYYETGELKAEVNFEMGKKEGISKYFHKNGHLRKKETLKEGIREGETTLFYENGAIKERLNYKEGNLNAESLKYNMDGEVIKRTFYDNGHEVEEPVLPIEEKENQPVSKYARQFDTARNVAYNKQKTPEGKTDAAAFSKHADTEEKPAKVKKATKEEIRREKVKRAVNYSMLFFGSLILIYFIYNLIIYLL